jgi:hypothetical protein
LNEELQAGAPSSYYGRQTRRLENGHCWVEVLALGGPRIVGFGLAGEENVLAETPEARWDAGYGIFELLGGHRLWFAPESAECSVPDASGVTATVLPEVEGSLVGIRLVGAFEPPTGLRREMKVRLGIGSSTVSIRHILRNEGSIPLEVSLWPITQLKLGGVARVELPEPTAAHAIKPSQLIALWPYASWQDERLTIADRSATVAGTPGKPFKIGFLNGAGAASYLRSGVQFTKRFDPGLDSPHADMGCNLEIYCDEGAIELESLSPLMPLAPGESITHDERWELSRVG